MRRSKINTVVSELEAVAYQRGVKDTVHAIMDAVKKIRKSHRPRTTKSQGKSTYIDASKIPGPMASNGSTPRFRKNSDQSRVFQTIKQHPGLRGSEVIDLLKKNGTGINDKTARTALRRLRVNEYIEQRGDERWYAREG